MAASKKAVAAAKPTTDSTRKVLVVDVGGTHVKVLATGQKESRKIGSGPTMTPERIISRISACWPRMRIWRPSSSVSFTGVPFSLTWQAIRRHRPSSEKGQARPLPERNPGQNALFCFIRKLSPHML